MSPKFRKSIDDTIRYTEKLRRLAATKSAAAGCAMELQAYSYYNGYHQALVDVLRLIEAEE